MPALIESLSLTGDGWSLRVFTSRFEATNATVLVRGQKATVIDAPYFPDEIVGDLGAIEVTLVATHSHFDHLLARYAFPSAPLVVGLPTAQALAEDGDAALRQLEEFDSKTYVERPGPLRFWPLEGVASPWGEGRPRLRPGGRPRVRRDGGVDRRGGRAVRRDVAYLDAGMKAIPPGRDTPRQREIHLANLERHAPATALSRGGRST